MANLPRLPSDPRLAALVRSQLSRRSVLAASGGLGLAGVLAGCGTGSDQARPTPAEDLSEEERILRWANWTFYLDLADDEETRPSLEKFREETGIEVTYAEDIESNEAYLGRIQPQLAQGRDIGQDLIVLTDWAVSRLIRAGQVQELNKENIPNGENLLQLLEDVDFDQGRQYSYPWQGGFVVVAWNKEKVPGGIGSISDLWRPELKGRVEVLDDLRDTIGPIMLEQGVDPSQDFGDDEFQASLDVLREQVESGQIRQVVGNSYTEDLVSEDALAVIGWSGDIFQINAENDDRWGFAIPEAGSLIWSDNVTVPIGSTHKTNAERLVDFYYDPVNAATVAAYVNYVCPVEGAREEMEKIDPELAQSPWIFPDDELLGKVKVFRELEPDEETRYVEEFQRVIGN